MKRFVYVESTEGGADCHFVTNAEELTFLRGWGDVDCEREDMILCSFMRNAEIGAYYEHRLGICIRLKNE
jgi:hypothetical protein